MAQYFYFKFKTLPKFLQKQNSCAHIHAHATNYQHSKVLYCLLSTDKEPKKIVPRKPCLPHYYSRFSNHLRRKSTKN